MTPADADGKFALLTVRYVTEGCDVEGKAIQKEGKAVDITDGVFMLYDAGAKKLNEKPPRPASPAIRAWARATRTPSSAALTPTGKSNTSSISKSLQNLLCGDPQRRFFLYGVYHARLNSPLHHWRLRNLRRRPLRTAILVAALTLMVAALVFALSFVLRVNASIQLDLGAARRRPADRSRGRPERRRGHPGREPGQRPSTWTSPLVDRVSKIEGVDKVSYQTYLVTLTGLCCSVPVLHGRRL